jgi:DMSO/TMAO reductase YedYZ molybdopterin-dependent catalytic subunit
MKETAIIGAAITILLVAIIAPATAISESLKITDLSNIEYNFTYQQLQEMPKTIVYADLFCYGNLVTRGDWAGVQLKYILNQTDITSDVKSIEFLAADNYAVSIPLYVAQMSETIIAYERDGNPLSEGLRLVLPGCNGASWIAQIEYITMSNTEVIAPAVISDNSLLSDFNGRGVAPNLTPNLTPNKSTPTPTALPITPSPTQSSPPKNNTEVEPETKQDIIKDQSIGLTLESVVIIVLAVVIGFALAALIFSRKKNSVRKQTI